MSESHRTLEVNFDGLVGPTHNYAGLAFGNVASVNNAGSISSPKQAAKQGLAKMHLLMQMGVRQAVLPPHQRPNLQLLTALGFLGNPQNQIKLAYKYQPELIAACFSAASMWTANAATISPSANTLDSKLHITPANLLYNLHRAQEAQFNYKLFQKIFSNPDYFTVHEPLLGYRDLSDEGAANHSNLCIDYGTPGLELFVYGRSGLKDHINHHTHFPARQTKLASSAIIRNHGVSDKGILLQQSPIAIDAGVFHNDVIFVANKNVLLMHDGAFLNWDKTREFINSFFNGSCNIIQVSERELSIKEAVATYIFNSQLVSLPDNSMALIVPMECMHSKQAKQVLDAIVAGRNPVTQVKFLELRESMRNGGGPACLRLRIVLNPNEYKNVLPSVILTERLYKQLQSWIEKHYRDKLSPDDLLDPSLINEVYTALDELTKILNLGNIYPFQLL